MSEQSAEHVIKALGYGLRHLIDTKPVAVDADRPQDCQVVYLYAAAGEDDVAIFGMDYPSGTTEFGDEAWCNAAYDAMEELAEARPAGVPLGFLLCTPMVLADPATEEPSRGFWYAFGMDLQHGLKVTMKEEVDLPVTVKPVSQPSMAGMLDQFSELFG